MNVVNNEKIKEILDKEKPKETVAFRLHPDIIQRVKQLTLEIKKENPSIKLYDSDILYQNY